MCAKTKLMNAPVWFKVTLASTFTFLLASGTTLWTFAVRDTSISKDFESLGNKVEVNAGKLEQADDDRQEDHDKLTQVITRQGYILTTLDEIKSLIKESK